MCCVQRDYIRRTVATGRISRGLPGRSDGPRTNTRQFVKQAKRKALRDIQRDADTDMFRRKYYVSRENADSWDRTIQRQ